MKTAVLYKTMTGCTQKYSEIIASELGADLFPLKRAGAGKLKGYDAVVFGGCVHAGKISGLDKFKRIAEKCGNAKLAVFAVGASQENAGNTEKLLTGNFPAGTGNMKFFYMQGGFEVNKMKQPFKGFMKWIRKMVEQNPNKKPDEIEFLKMFEATDDPVNKKNAEELGRYVRGS